MANLVTDSRENDSASSLRLRQSRSVVMVLKRAAKVVGRAGDTTGEAARVLIEGVHDSIFDLLGLQLQVGHDMGAVKDSVKAVEEGMHLYKASNFTAEDISESVAEARSLRRQRKLDQVEIPEDHVIITGDLLGKGGFGEVFLADYNGHNAAAKVLRIGHDLGVLDENQKQLEANHRRAFLRELEAMIRLRSPNTVNVFGAVTSLPDCMVLVMELLSGGDLLTMVRKSKEPLPEEQSRRIIGDICTGMAFLHSKNTVHGDLKSANVLLDGSGRAKVILSTLDWFV
ncbi:unnamed protein product [Pylaiella littoralis]